MTDEKKQIKMELRNSLGSHYKNISALFCRDCTPVKRHLRSKICKKLQINRTRLNKLSEHSKKQIVNLFVAQGQSPYTVKRTLNLAVFLRPVQILLKRTQHVVYENCEQNVSLMKIHKHCRLNRAKAKFLCSSTNWDTVVFTNAKIQQVSGERSLNFLENISYKGIVGLVEFQKNINFENCLHVSQHTLLPEANASSSNDCIFQQDSATVHNSNISEAFLETNKIAAIDRPAKPLD